MGWLKKFGPVQNILGPVKGQGINLYHFCHFSGREWWARYISLSHWKILLRPARVQTFSNPFIKGQWWYLWLLWRCWRMGTSHWNSGKKICNKLKESRNFKLKNTFMFLKLLHEIFLIWLLCLPHLMV